MKKLRKLNLLLILIIGLCSVGAFAQGRAKVHTTWDDNYFYASFFIDDPDIVGVNRALHSSPWDDDSVEIFLETDNLHNTGRPKTSFHMAVSAAGGAAFTVGTEAGTWERRNIVTFKYVPKVDGSINNSDDLDIGYTIELALPWFELGVKPPTPGTMMSFNALVRMRGETDKLISLSPEVQTEEDIHDASKWVNIVFTGSSFGAATISLDKIVSAKYVTRMPLIDGQIRPKEWNNNTSFSLDLPFDELVRKRNQFQKTILTSYHYWYQGDPRKAAPYAMVRSENGSCMLIDQPIRSAGPWFSYDRVQMHKDEFLDIRRAGVDIVLPVYAGDSDSRKAFAAKGLDCIIEAICELKAEKKPYPMLGMLLDTSAMEAAYGAKPDLKDDEVKRSLYGMIRDFFIRVPFEFRAQVQVADDRAARPCFIVSLGSSDAFSDFDSTFIDYVNERFAKEFDANILWLGDNYYKGKSAAFDGYCSLGTGSEFGYDDSAKIRLASVNPGFDNSAVAASDIIIRPRLFEETYKGDWNKVFDKNPNWVVLDGWNDLRQGRAISGSKQYGFSYVDLTALQSLKFRGAREYDAKYLRHNTPSVILPQKFYLVDVLVQNDGIKPWRAAEGFGLAYRWYQDGRPVGESDIKRPIQTDVLPGRSLEIPVGLAAVREGGQPLPEGNYEVRFEMVRLSDGKWFSSLGDEGITVQVKIGNPQEYQAAYTVMDGLVMMKSGAAYPHKIRIRNDGSATWKGGTAEVGCRLFNSSSYVHGGPDDVWNEVAIAPIRVTIPKDVDSGESVDLLIPVQLMDAAGQPVPAWKQSDQWSYVLRFDVWDGSRWISDAGADVCDRVVSLFDADYGANIIASDLPDVLEAGKSYDVKLVVRNNGIEPWIAEKFGIGCHWYYLDGTEAIWDGGRTPIKATVKPGEPCIVNAKVTIPAFDGQYIIAWDLHDGSRWASTADISRGGDILIAEVTVQNGKLKHVDLSKLFDVVAMSYDGACDSADFDGSKSSFPAELMPPDLGVGRPNQMYPSGYFGKVVGSGPESLRRISFTYPDKAVGAKTAVACAGQTVGVPKGKYVRLHVLGASIEPAQQADFQLKYSRGLVPSAVIMSSWAEEPANGEEIAFTALHKHTSSGNEKGSRCHLFHYVINVDATNQLEEIVLPTNGKVRIVGLTLEKL